MSKRIAGELVRPFSQNPMACRVSIIPRQSRVLRLAFSA